MLELCCPGAGVLACMLTFFLHGVPVEYENTNGIPLQCEYGVTSARKGADPQIYSKKGNCVAWPHPSTTNSLFLCLPIFQCGTDSMLLECFHGTQYNGFYVNRKLIFCKMWLIGVVNGKLLCAQLDIIGVHIVVGVNNMPNIRPAVIYMPLKSTLPHEFNAWFLHRRLEWIEEFVRLCIHVMGAGNKKLKLSAAKWDFLLYYGNM